MFILNNDIIFPDVSQADEYGMLAIGGDLSVERLLCAYKNGIFPWYNEDEPIIWWSPDPRSVVFPGEFHCSRSLTREFRRGTFEVTMDLAFPEVIQGCAKAKRKHERGTWIVPAMQKAYTDMHLLGHAHSIECWQDGELAGGLYGLCLGGMFFGESMFSRVANASKVAMAVLVAHCAPWGIRLIDSQVANAHTLSLGAREIPRGEYMQYLGRLVGQERQAGPWTIDPEVLAGLGQKAASETTGTEM